MSRFAEQQCRACGGGAGFTHAENCPEHPTQRTHADYNIRLNAVRQKLREALAVDQDLRELDIRDVRDAFEDELARRFDSDYVRAR